tara:strand:- start:46 stop:573 length:528 start_codon:yes stop_codon:yes gene_type:complete
MSYLGAPLMSVNQTWGTPSKFMEYMKTHIHFVPDLDAAASFENKKANRYFSELDNSLDKDWFGKVWLNPPFGKVLLPKFLDKCNEQIQRDEVEEIFVLIPARTDTKWFHEKVMKGAKYIYLIKGRFNFESPYSTDGANAPFPSMLVHYVGKTYNNNIGKVIIKTLDVPKEYRGWK